jgi:IS1 family transposase
MNILPIEQQVAAIAALTEGCSIRATERLTGIHRDTIMRLSVRVGQGCAELHDAMFRGLNVGRLELDEIWSFVHKKQRRLLPGDPADFGDQYTFIGMDASRKAIISYRTGKRDRFNTCAFAMDLRERILNQPEISSDAFSAYRDAIDNAFGIDCHYGQITKVFAGDAGQEASRRYAPGHVVGVQRAVLTGNPTRISTSLVERQNLTVRMQQRRFTRLTNGFSKKLENHAAAVAMYVAHYNLCRVHEALRITPAMAIGVADHIWTISELVDAALADTLPKPAGRQAGRFRVIDGGLS